MDIIINRLSVPFLFAFFVGLILTPVTIIIARKINAVDSPHEERKIHEIAMPRLGGIAIFIAANAGMWLFSNYPMNVKMGILLGGIVIAITGVLDDIFTMSAKAKLLMQIIAAIVVVSFGIKIEILTNIFTDSKYIYLGILGIPATIFWIVGITNTVNLIDGLDGLAAGTAIIASMSLAYIAIINGRVETAILLVVLAGGALGFLPYNFNPAKTFMGDSGSLFLGYYLSVVTMLGAVKGAAAIAYILPILALGLPIFDTTYAILRRIITKKPIMEADRGHLHHRLLDIGLHHKNAVLLLYLISILLGLSAAFYSADKITNSLITLIVVFIIVIIPIRRTSSIEWKD